MLLSTGLSLPNETGRGLSEHGEASRDTLSESSSLNIVPGKLRLKISSNLIRLQRKNNN